MRRRLPLILWTALIVMAVVPWWNLETHVHFEHVQWVPFVTPPQKLSDVVANVLMYVPFGYLYAREREGPLWHGVAYAAALSVVTETSQVFSHWRYPSNTDVACNVFGAWAGVRLAMTRRERSQRASPTKIANDLVPNGDHEAWNR